MAGYCTHCGGTGFRRPTRERRFTGGGAALIEAVTEILENRAFEYIHADDREMLEAALRKAEQAEPQRATISHSAKHWMNLYEVVAAEQRALVARVSTVIRYDDKLRRMRVVPDGADYKIVLDLLIGVRKRCPNPERAR